MRTTNDSAKDIINETYCETPNFVIDNMNNYHVEDDDSDDDYNEYEHNYESKDDTNNKYYNAGFPDDFDWV